MFQSNRPPSTRSTWYNPMECFPDHLEGYVRGWPKMSSTLTPRGVPCKECAHAVVVPPVWLPFRAGTAGWLLCFPARTMRDEVGGGIMQKIAHVLADHTHTHTRWLAEATRRSPRADNIWMGLRTNAARCLGAKKNEWQLAQIVCAVLRCFCKRATFLYLRNTNLLALFGP